MPHMHTSIYFFWFQHVGKFPASRGVPSFAFARLTSTRTRKLQVLKRYKHFIPIHAKKRLYLAYFLPHLTYCSTVWFHCGKRNADIIEKLNESILPFVFNDFNNSYEKLLQEINQPSLGARRINDMLILVFLALNNAASSYISDLFTPRQTSISLRGKHRLVIPCVSTTNYRLHSFRYHASKPWNLLLLLPSKMHYKLSIWKMTAVLFVTNIN